VAEAWTDERHLTPTSTSRGMMFHEFKIGQPVGYRPPRGLYVPEGTFIISKLLASLRFRVATTLSCALGIES
jgi:hypothetical protein